MSFDKEKESVRSLLRRAFLSWRGDSNSPALDHDGCLEMRAKLIAVRPEDIEYFLPQVLEDLLDTHTNNAGDSQDAETVVDFLDVPTLELDAEFIREKWGRETLAKFRSDAKNLRSAKQAALAGVTRDQAQAICQWLKYARTWGDLEWNMDSVESALSYWSKRVASHLSV